MKHLIIVLSFIGGSFLYSCGEQTQDGQFQHDMERETTGERVGHEGEGTNTGTGVGGIAIDTADVNQQQRDTANEQEATETENNQ